MERDIKMKRCNCRICRKRRGEDDNPKKSNQTFELSPEAQITKLKMEEEERIRQQGLSTQEPVIYNSNESVFNFFELGFMQAHESMPKIKFFEDFIFSENTNVKTINNIYSLNEHINDPIRKGEIIIIADGEPSSDEEKKQLELLKEQSVAASEALAELTTEENNTLHRYLLFFDEQISEYLLEAKLKGMPTDNFAYASVGVGSIATGSQTYLKGMQSTLEQIEKLYIDKIATPTSKNQKINYPKFHAERLELFSKLDNQLSKLTMKSLDIPVQHKLKNSLKLSTKSIIHNADEIVKGKSIPDYGKRIANVSIAVKGAEKVGWIGIGFGLASAVYNISEACRENGADECGKQKTIETTGFIFGLLGGYAGGKVGSVAGGALLVLIGVTSAPVIAVGVATSAVIGGAVGGIYGSGAGKIGAEILYEKY